MDGPIIGDAFGQMLLDRLAAPEKDAAYPELIERDDGLLQVGPGGGYFRPYEQWPEAEQLLVDKLSGRVLDIGAGGGRIALYLQARGCDVVALDVSAGAIDVSRRRGVLSYFEGTTYDLAAMLPEPFDAFVLCGGNLGLLGGRAEAPRLLAVLASIAKPGGVIVGTCLDPYATDNSDHLTYHQSNRERGRMGGQLRLRWRHRNLASPWFDYLFCSPAEAEELVAGTAWELAEVNRDEEGPGYNVVLRLQ